MENSTLKNIRDFKMNMKLNKLKKVNKNELEMTDSPFTRESATRGQHLSDSIPRSTTDSTDKENKLYAKLYQTQTASNLKQVAKRHEEINKNHQLSDNLIKIRSKVDNILSKTKVITKDKRVTMSYHKLATLTFKLFKKTIVASWFNLANKQVSIIRESFNNFEDMHDIQMRIRNNKENDKDTNDNSNSSLLNNIQQDAKHDNLSINIEVNKDFKFDNNQSAKNSKTQTMNINNNNLNSTRTFESLDQTNKNYTKYNSSKNATESRTLGSTQFYSIPRSETNSKFSPLKVNEANYNSSPSIQVKTLNEYKPGQIMSNRSSQMMSVEKKSINQSVERKLYSSRRKKLLNFNGFNTFLTVLIKNKERTDALRIKKLKISFDNWILYSSNKKLQDDRVKATNAITSAVVKIQNKRVLQVLDKIKLQKLKLKQMVQDKRFVKMFRCIINLLMTINTKKGNQKRQNQFQKWRNIVNSIKNEETKSKSESIHKFFSVFQSKHHQNKLIIQKILKNYSISIAKRENGIKNLIIQVNKIVKNRLKNLLMTFKENIALNHYNEVQGNIMEENSILKAVLFGNSLSKVISTKITEINSISFQELKKNNNIQNLAKEYIHMTHKKSFKNFTNKIYEMVQIKMQKRILFQKKILHINSNSKKLVTKQFIKMLKSFQKIKSTEIEINYSNQLKLSKLKSVLTISSKIEKHYLSKYFQLFIMNSFQTSDHHLQSSMQFRSNNPDSYLRSPTTDTHARKYLSQNDKFSVSRSQFKSNFDSLVKSGGLDASELDTRRYECSIRAKYNLNGVILIKNILNRVLRRVLAYSNLFTIGHAKGNGRMIEDKKIMKNTLPRAIARVFQIKFKHQFELLKISSSAKIIERLFNGYKLYRLIQLLNTNHTFVKNKVFRCFIKNSSLNESNLTFNSQNDKIQQLKSMCFLNKMENLQLKKQKNYFKDFVNANSSISETNIENTLKFENSFVTCKDNISSKRIFDNSNWRDSIPREIEPQKAKQIEIKITQFKYLIKNLQNIMKKYFNEFRQQSIKLQQCESKVSSLQNQIGNKLSNTSLKVRLNQFFKWKNHITIKTHNEKQTELEDTQFSIQKKNSLNNHSIHLISKVIKIIQFKNKRNAFEILKQSDNNPKNIKKQIKLAVILSKNKNNLSHSNQKQSFLIWSKFTKLCSFEDRMKLFLSRNDSSNSLMLNKQLEYSKNEFLSREVTSPIQNPKSSCQVCTSTERKRKECLSPQVSRDPKKYKEIQPEAKHAEIGRVNPKGKQVHFKSNEKVNSLLSPNEKQSINGKHKETMSLLSPNNKNTQGKKKLISLISLDNL